jgi:hypothetical protein
VAGLRSTRELSKTGIPYTTMVDGVLSASKYGVGGCSSVVFSVGDSGNAMTSPGLPAGLTVMISEGIMTFSYPQTNKSFGIGDVVVYGPAKECFLQEKISQTEWKVKTKFGLLPSDESTPLQVTSVSKVWNKMADVFGVTGLSYHLSSSDLIALDLRVDIALYAITETVTAPIITTGFNMDLVRRIAFFCPENKLLNVNASQRHPGYWSSSAYTLKGASGLLNVSSPYFIFDGIQFESTSQTSDVIAVMSNANIVLKNCLVKGGYRGIHFSYLGPDNLDTSDYVICNNFFGQDLIAISANASASGSPGRDMYIYSNTIFGNGTLDYGISTVGPILNVTLKNNLIQNTSVKGLDLQSGGINTYTLTQDGTALTEGTVLTGCLASKVVRFINPTAMDLRLFSGDAFAVGAGISLESDSAFAFKNDIEGRLIGKWCIGSDFQKRKSFVSIGASYAMNGSPSITITMGVATLSIAQTNNNIGIGDKITYNTSLTCYIAGKISTTQFFVVGLNGVAPADSGSVSVNSITRSYSTFALTLSALSTAYSNDLVSANVEANIIPYDVSENSVSIGSGWTVNDFCFFAIRSAYDTSTQCNVSHRRQLNYDKGCVLKKLTINANFTVVEGIKISESSDDAIVINSDGASIVECIMSQCENGIVFNGISLESSRVVNCLFHSITNTSIKVKDVLDSDLANLYVYNCTFFRIENGIYAHYDEPRYKRRIHVLHCGFKAVRGKCFLSTYPNSDLIQITSCVTSDHTGRAFANSQCYFGKEFSLKSPEYRGDLSPAFCNNYLFSDGYNFTLDYDMNPEGAFGLNEADLSTPGYNANRIKYNEVIFSAGLSQNHLDVMRPMMSIKDGIITFSLSQIDNQLGVGDKVIFDVASVETHVFLYEKGDAYNWMIKNGNGSTPSNVTGIQVKRIVRSFDSINKALDLLEEGVLTSGYYGASRDLVANKCAIKIACYDDQLSTYAGGVRAVSKGEKLNTNIQASWVTSKYYNLTVFVPYDTNRHCNVSQRHTGWWGSTSVTVRSGFSIEPAANNVLTANADYTIIDGLKVFTPATKKGIVTTGDSCLIIGCIVKAGAVGIELADGNAFSNVVYDTTSIGIECNASAVANCVVHSCPTGIKDVPPPKAILTNNIIQNCSTDYTNGMNVQNSLGSSDTVLFEDAPTRKLWLKRAAVNAIGKGEDLYIAYGVYVFVDIAGTINHFGWHIGAFYKYNATSFASRSVGPDSLDHKTGAPLIKVDEGLATFYTKPLIDEYPEYQTDRKLMSGMKVEASIGANPYVFYLTTKKSNYEWNVVDAFGNTPVGIQGAIVDKISFCYTSLLTAVSSLETELGTKDISAFGSDVTIHLADMLDDVDITPVAISGWSTDKNRTFHFNSPVDVRLDCNLPQHHNGLWHLVNPSIGYKLLSDSAAPALLLSGLRYATLSGIMVKNPGGNGIVINSKDVIVRECVASDCGATGFMSTETDTRFHSCVSHECVVDGFSCDASAILTNCISAYNSVGGFNTAGLMYNCYGKSNTLDFVTPNSLSKNCVSSDSSLVGISTCIANRSVNDFADVTNGDFRLNPATSADVRGVGFNVTALVDSPNYAYANGIKFGRFINIGALAIKGKAVSFSVSTEQTNLVTPNAITVTVGLSTADGRAGQSIARFSPSISDLDVGEGVVVEYDITGTTYYMYLKELLAEVPGTFSEWIVSDRNGNAVVDGTFGSVLAIRHPYSNLFDAIRKAPFTETLHTAQSGGLLSTLGLTVSVVSYAGPTNVTENTNLTIDNLTTIYDSNFIVKVPGDVGKDCYINQRFKGYDNTGVYLGIGSAGDAILVLSNNIEFHGLSLIRASADYSSRAIHFFRTSNALVRDCQIIDFGEGVWNERSNSGSKSSFINNSFMGLSGVSIKTGGKGASAAYGEHGEIGARWSITTLNPGYDKNAYTVQIVNNYSSATPQITWGATSVLVEYMDEVLNEKSPQWIFANATVVGTAWGTFATILTQTEDMGVLPATAISLLENAVLGHDDVTSDDSFIYNNTIRNCINGVHLDNDVTFKASATCKNNLVQIVSGIGFAADGQPTILSTPAMKLYACISSDGSAAKFQGSRNYANTLIQFSDALPYDYRPLRYNDPKLFLAYDLSMDVNYKFNRDITFKERDFNSWEIGAFEVIVDKSGYGNMEIWYVQIGSSIATVSGITEPIVLRLRHGANGSNNTYGSVWDLSQAAKDFDTDNLLIYVQGRSRDLGGFFGTFDLGDRGVKTVSIETEPSERGYGPAFLIASTQSTDIEPTTGQRKNEATGSGPLNDEDNRQLIVKFTSIQIQMLNASSVFVPNAHDSTYFVFHNCIIQVNGNSIIDQAPCGIRSINSQIIYRNQNADTEFFLTKNINGLTQFTPYLDKRFVSNTIFLVYANAEVKFGTVNNPIGRAEDSVWNCMAFNYYPELSSFFSDHAVVNAPLLNQMPLLFSDPILDKASFDIEETMNLNLQTSPYSPCKQLGNNNKLDGIVFDILGFDRIFDRGIVDIGPYSIILFKKFFYPNQIGRVFQDNLKFIPSNRPAEVGQPIGTIQSENSGIVYDWLASDLLFLQQDIEEYCRESKIMFELKLDTAEYRLLSDKRHKYIATLEAHLDKGRNTIIITKTPDLINNVFDSLFDDGRFVFFLNEEESTLTIYESNTYDKGAAGQRNIINNVRFGGSPVLN